jgi:stage IV sporulation protein FB
MRWSFRLARVLGTDIKIHVTFLLLLAWFAWADWQQGGSAAALTTTVTLLAVFACVLLHEFGHILMARRFGVRTPDVILLPIGGMARLERMPDEPKQEFLIAIAGPLVTLGLAALFLGLGLLLHQPFLVEESAPLTIPLVPTLFFLNVILLLFNLIPAFPMDGGRVLRALLASRLGLARATRIAARVGQVLAIGFALAGIGIIPGLGGNIILVLIALFIFAGAGAEASAVETRFAGAGLTVDSMMMTRFQAIPVHARLADAARLLLEGDQKEFPVVDNLGRVEGLLTRDQLMRGIELRGQESTVAESMTAQVPRLQPEVPFPVAMAHLRASRMPALPVVDSGGALVGLLSLENIAEVIRLRKARGEL